jgi:preprotein translocase subunit SecE
MSTNEDLEKKEAEGEEHLPEAEAGAEEKSDAKAESRSENGEGDKNEKRSPSESAGEGEDDKAEAVADKLEDAPLPVAPVQLGYRRFVYAAYFGFAIIVTFIAAKSGNMIWYRVSQWKPQWNLGDPNDELIWVGAAALGLILTLYYYRKPKSRQYVDEVANELSQVTWPSRKEVTNGTSVVIVTTVFATVFFALMDRFWGFVTNLVYGS